MNHAVSEYVAWTCALFATIFSIRVAQAFLLQNARLYTSIALFALVWALLVPYYGTPGQSELFAAFGGFLLIYIGDLIYREGKLQTGNNIGILARWSLWLLPIIVSPTAIGFLHPDGEFALISKEEVEVILSTILTVLGFIAIARGGKAYFKNVYAAYFILILVAGYSILEICFLKSVINFCGTVKEMSDGYRYLFAIAKIIFAFSFSWLIAANEMRKNNINLSLNEKLLKLITG